MSTRRVTGSGRCKVGFRRNTLAARPRVVDCQNTGRRTVSSTSTMSAAVNPGLKDTPVDMDKLLKAVGCPICGEMFTHPVTVVRPRARDREFPRCPNSFFPSRTFRRLTSPPRFVSRETMECLHTFATSASSSPQPGRGANNVCPTCIKLGNNPFVEKKVVKDQVKVSIVGQAEGVGGVGWGGRRGAPAPAPAPAPHRRRHRRHRRPAPAAPAATEPAPAPEPRRRLTSPRPAPAEPAS